jgi:DNA-binding winged helix-turn-helix (wHTH) protein
VALKLRRKPFAILKYLARNPNRLVTHQELTEAIWGKVSMSENVLRTHVYDIRDVLGEGIIETVVGRGYRFLLEVRAMDRTGRARVKPDAASQSSLVGREREIDELRGHLARSLERERQVVFLMGEPGIGKTALMDAILREAKVRFERSCRIHSTPRRWRGSSPSPSRGCGRWRS